MRLMRLVFVVAVLCLPPLSAVRAQCVGLITSGSYHQFWHDMSTGAQKAAQDLGIKMLFRAPRVEEETQTQLRLILSLRKYGCDAFVIAPNDVSINAVVSSLKAEQVPTVYVDRNTTRQSAIVSLVMTDNYAAGRWAAREVLDLIPKGGRVALFGLKKGVTSTDAREKGFADYMQEAGNPVVAQRYLGVGPDEAAWHSRDFFLRENDPAFDAVFTPNESTTEAVNLALNELTATGKVRDRPLHVGFDLSRQIAQAIEAETIAGVIIQDPYEMGYQGVVIAHRARQGMEVEAVVNTPFKFITRENLSTTNLQN